MNLALTSAESIAFGRFRISPRRRMLLADDKPVRLGGRAFDLLMVLIETPGAVVSKDDLLARVWRDRVVTETSLQTQILALRRAFGAERDLIRTVAGRGYQFTGQIRFVSPDSDKLVAEGFPVAAEDAVTVPTNLPQPVSELIGRAAEVEEVLSLVRAGRLVTLTGPGGIGKTRLALAVARRLLLQFPDGVWLAEFSPLSDPSLVPATVAAAAGLDLGGGELSARRVAQVLAARPMLVVLDTCEHVIDAATTMAEAVLRAGSAASIIATSREPLRAEGEQLYPVPPLAVPPEDAQDILEYGAVRLFVERARAAEPDLTLDRYRAAAIAAICRRLDGIPLAIEMAAARLAALGVEELARRLDNRLQLLTGGRRTALPRHQTLRATLDWSYELLAEPERVLLRRLAVFAGVFRLEAVAAVVASDETASLEVVDGLSSLVAKSLVVAEVGATIPRYRLMDSPRAYALEKLAESGEQELIARRHAEYYRYLFERAEAELEMRPTAEWLGDYGRQIDNVRAALGWAFSPGAFVHPFVLAGGMPRPRYAGARRSRACR
jgi:predicted ATPase/DNA-binding winged helix-turn-helix (wHTH) protein